MKYLPVTFTDTPNLPLLCHIVMFILFDLRSLFFSPRRLVAFLLLAAKNTAFLRITKSLKDFFFDFFAIPTGPLPAGKKVRLPQRK